MDIPLDCNKADLTYKVTPQKNLMLTFLPPLIKKYDCSPVYFLIPGGGWHSETRQSMIGFSDTSVQILRNEGFAAVSIDYRVCRQGAVMREIVTDCFDAIRYIVYYADILKIDRQRIYVSGHSAGAHLALMLAYSPSDSFADRTSLNVENDMFKIKAVAALSSPTVLYDSSTHHLLDLKDVFAGCYTLDELKAMSPITYVSKESPPTILCAGTSDYLVFSTSSERLYEVLKANNVKSKIILSVGAGHCFEKVHRETEPSVSLREIQDCIAEYIIKQNI